MIDRDGYRLNVGMVLLAPHTPTPQVLLAKRLRQDAWQFPQGGMRYAETPYEACIRELKEELGLSAEGVACVAQTQDWLHYRLPEHLIRRARKPVCIGQKQIWFLFKLVAPESEIRFDSSSERPEFESWRWVDYWEPVSKVVYFKRAVYHAALTELASRAGLVVPPAPTA